jgi:hypothetical protein
MLLDPLNRTFVTYKNDYIYCLALEQGQPSSY